MHLDVWGGVLIVLVAGVLAFLVGIVLNHCDEIAEQRAEVQRRRVEAELDRKQVELRRTILALADALATERLAATHASQQIVAHAYLTTGRVP